MAKWLIESGSHIPSRQAIFTALPVSFFPQNPTHSLLATATGTPRANWWTWEKLITSCLHACPAPQSHRCYRGCRSYEADQRGEAVLERSPKESRFRHQVFGGEGACISPHNGNYLGVIIWPVLGRAYKKVWGEGEGQCVIFIIYNLWRIYRTHGRKNQTSKYKRIKGGKLFLCYSRLNPWFVPCRPAHIYF